MNVSADKRVNLGPATLAARAAADQALLTYYDDATGERVELSAAALGTWVARTANLLADGCGLTPGSRAAVLLPPHWQTAAVVLGAWSAGMSVDFHSLATTGVPGTDAEPPFNAGFDATFATLPRHHDTPAARVRFVLALGTPGQVPAGCRDYLGEVRRHRAEVRPYGPARETGATTVDGTYEEWANAARGMAATYRLRAGDRVLVDAASHEHPLRWLLAPLAAGASVVLCANLDPRVVAARTAREGVTRVL